MQTDRRVCLCLLSVPFYSHQLDEWQSCDASKVLDARTSGTWGLSGKSLHLTDIHWLPGQLIPWCSSPCYEMSLRTKGMFREWATPTAGDLKRGWGKQMPQGISWLSFRNSTTWYWKLLELGFSSRGDTLRCTNPTAHGSIHGNWLGPRRFDLFYYCYPEKWLYLSIPRIFFILLYQTEDRFRQTPFLVISTYLSTMMKYSPNILLTVPGCQQLTMKTLFK